MWVLVAGILVMFMQAGFAFLEIGFSRGKNAGTVIAKILVNFSICAICFYAVGFAFAFGDGNQIIGTSGFFLAGADASANFPLVNVAEGTVTVETLWFFQFVFAAVSLAIVWGTTLERIKFGVYVIYAIVFSSIIYPIGAHWIFGGGWLATKFGMQDFAGSTVVHLIGATGALAALLLLGPRRGKYGAGRQAARHPGPQHAAVRSRRADPVARLVRLQPGLRPERARRPLPGDRDGHEPRGRRGRDRRRRDDVLQDQADRHRHGGQRRDRRPGRHHRPVGLRRAVGRADHRRASPA